MVLDGRFDPVRAAEVARLVARLGLDGVWWRQPPLTGTAPGDLAAFLSRLRAEAAPASAGLIADSELADPGLLTGLTSRPAGAGADSPGPLRLALAGPAPRIARWLDWLADHPGAFADAAVPAGMPAAVPAGTAAGAAAMPPGTPLAIFVPIFAGRAVDPAVSAAAAQAAGGPVLVELAVSVGRTTGEAHARAHAEDLFAVTGQPAQDGLFGTLEECQASAARLAHAGATELVCYLPRSDDLPDVLAQLSAIAVGAALLRPGEPPSSPPPPPTGWGGRRSPVADT